MAAVTYPERKNLFKKKEKKNNVLKTVLENRKTFTTGISGIYFIKYKKQCLYYKI